MSSVSQLPVQFDKYSILGHLATGGMAEVYLARQAGLQGFEKLVVIKRVRPELMADREVTRSFLDEARLVATLQHPNIAQVYEVGLVEGSYFFAMEYVHGADLRQVMQRAIDLHRRISLGDAIYILIQVCIAMHYAHEKRDFENKPLHIVHRDVTPSNVLLSLDGAVKVCDFGIAKTSNKSHETTRGVLKGKYSYMSPEQCRGKPLDRRSDIFALGILLYELTTLTKLFTGDSEFELLRGIVEGQVPPPSKRVSHYPPDLERIVMRALAKDPEQRFPTAQAMQLALEDFVRELKLQQSPVAIAKLMNDLFDKRLEPWLRAQQEGKPLAEFLVDTAIRRGSNMPVFLPIGTSEDELDGLQVETTLPRATPGHSFPASPARVSQPAPVHEPTQATGRPSAVWLIAAAVAGLAAGGAVLAGRALEHAAQGSNASALASDADRIASTIDSAARSAHARASSIAATPVLRAAIATDAATVRDLADKENLLAASSGEEIEIFQLGGGTPASLLRVPAGAPALSASGNPTRLEVHGQDVRVVASAPIASTASGVSGEVVVALPIELASARQQLAAHAASATLDGPDLQLELVPPHGVATNQPRMLQLATSDGGLGGLSLAVVPIGAADAAMWPLRAAIASGAICLILFVLYVIGLARAKRA